MKNIDDLPPELLKLLTVILHGDRYRNRTSAKMYAPNGARECARRARQIETGKLYDIDHGFAPRPYPAGAFTFLRAVKRQGMRSERKERIV